MGQPGVRHHSGVILPLFTAAYWPDRPVIRNWLAAAEFVLIVLYDIVKSNITVALIVLFRPRAGLQPAWVTVPLDLRSPEAITVLAGTITMTPARSRPICLPTGGRC